MRIASEALINPLVDSSLIPIDIPRFIYDMPYLDMEYEPTNVSGSPSGKDGPGIRTVDDMRYEMIMSYVHNNEVIGF